MPREREPGGFGNRLLENGARELRDETEAFGEWDEVVGVEEPACRVVPADERFDSTHSDAPHVERRLIMQSEGSAFDRGT